MDENDSEARSFVVEQAGCQYVLQAETEQQCREWITAIFQHITAAGQAEAGDGQLDFDDADLPPTHLVDHRFNLLLEKRPQNFRSF